MLSLGLYIHDEGIENLGCMLITKSCAWERSFWPYARLNALGIQFNHSLTIIILFTNYSQS